MPLPQTYRPLIFFNRHGTNVSATPLRQWDFCQCLPFSWTTLRGKHYQQPIAVMGVVDTFRHGELFREIGEKNDIQLFHLRAIRDHPFKALTFFRGEGSNICKMDSIKKNCRRWGVGVKNHRNLPTSKMDGPLEISQLNFFDMLSIFEELDNK